MINTYKSITKATASVVNHVWTALSVDGKPHPHSFSKAPYVRTAKVEARSDGSLEVYGGIKDYTILKTTGSGFVGYPKCNHTTLRETTDRFLSTKVEATWKFHIKTIQDGKKQASYHFDDVANKLLAVLNHTFATEYSVSVQATIWQIGERVLNSLPMLDAITLTMPNIHYLPLDLSRLGYPDNKDVLLPTSEPHGNISATISKSRSRL